MQYQTLYTITMHRDGISGILCRVPEIPRSNPDNAEYRTVRAALSSQYRPAFDRAMQAGGFWSNAGLDGPPVGYLHLYSQKSRRVCILRCVQQIIPK